MESEITKYEPYQTITISGRLINLRTILFIEISEINRGTKMVHFADHEASSLNNGVIEWRTRLSAKRIIEMLGCEIFIQIHRRYIINKYTICARKSDWKEIRLRIFLGYGKKSFMTNSINKIGKQYLPEIKRYICERYVEMKDKEGDVFFINPLDIICIRILKETKTVYFDCMYPDIGNKLEWKTRLSTSDIITNLRIDGFYKIHRRYIINCNFTFKADLRVRFLILNTKRTKTHHDLKIPVGSRYKAIVENCIS